MRDGDELMTRLDQDELESYFEELWENQDLRPREQKAVRLLMALRDYVFLVLSKQDTNARHTHSPLWKDAELRTSLTALCDIDRDIYYDQLVTQVLSCAKGVDKNALQMTETDNILAQKLKGALTADTFQRARELVDVLERHQVFSTIIRHIQQHPSLLHVFIETNPFRRIKLFVRAFQLVQDGKVDSGAVDIQEDTERILNKDGFLAAYLEELARIREFILAHEKDRRSKWETRLQTINIMSVMARHVGTRMSKNKIKQALYESGETSSVDVNDKRIKLLLHQDKFSGKYKSAFEDTPLLQQLVSAYIKFGWVNKTFYEFN